MTLPAVNKLITKMSVILLAHQSILYVCMRVCEIYTVFYVFNSFF